MIGPLLGALVSAGGLGLQGMGMKSANDVNWMNLFETKRANRKSEKLARSTKRDMYGNELEYIEGLGWVPHLTAMTQAILGAEQKETRANLEEDAPRNRKAAVRMDDRSKMADDEFEKTFNEFKYRPQFSEEAEISDATQQTLRDRKQGLDEAAGLLARQLIRTGGGSGLEAVYKKTGDMYADSLDEAMHNGRTIGSANFNQKKNNDLQQYGGELQLLKAIADTTTNTPVNYSNFNEQLTGRSDAGQAALIAAIESGRGASQAAHSQLANGLRQTPDVGGLASALAGLKMESASGADQQRQGKYLDPWEQWLTTRKRMSF